jgi:biotin-(acetyl-CoA carboxylase) ligase
VRVRLPRESFSGRFLDLDSDGVLLVETAAGPRRISAGEIFPAAA